MHEIFSGIGIKIHGHLKIIEYKNRVDYLAGREYRTILNKRNAIHKDNASILIVNALTHRNLGNIAYMFFGNGGTSLDSLGNVIFRPPNDTGTTADLYHPVFFQLVDDFIGSLPGNQMAARHISNSMFTDIDIRCLIDTNQPFSQLSSNQLSNINYNTATFAFNEIGLKLLDGTLITHVIFSPVLKTASSLLEVIYTLRIFVEQPSGPPPIDYINIVGVQAISQFGDITFSMPSLPMVYATGDFSSIGGVSEKGLAYLNPSDGTSAGLINQTLIDAGYGLAISPDKTTLYVGNSYDTSFDGGFLIMKSLPDPGITDVDMISISPLAFFSFYDVIATNSAIYAAGQFQYGTSGALIDLSTQLPSLTFPTFLNSKYQDDIGFPNYVAAAISDGAGGWFLGGSFNLVGSEGGTIPTTATPITGSIGASVEGYTTGTTLFVTAVDDGYISVNDGAGAYDGTNTLNATIVSQLTGATGGIGSYQITAAATPGDLTPTNITISSLIVHVIDGSGIYPDYVITNHTGHITNSPLTTIVSPILPTTNGVGFYNISGPYGQQVGTSLMAVFPLNSLNIAHIKSDGTVDLTFNPSPSGGPPSTQKITALILSHDGNTLYVGGNFTNIGGVSQTNVAAISPVTGAALSFNPTISHDFASFALSSDDSTLYVLNVVNSTHSELLQIDTATSVINYTSALTPQIVQILLSSDDSTIYFAGAGGPGKILASTGNITTTWTSNDVALTIILSPDESLLYVGGYFTMISGTSRNYIAALNTTSGADTGFAPNPDNGNIFTFEITPDGNTLYVSGGFLNIGGQARYNIAALNTGTGLATSFNPVPTVTPGVGSYCALTLSGDLSSIFIGGPFYLRQNLIAFDPVTKVMSNTFVPLLQLTYDSFDFESVVNTLALSSGGDTIYAGGSFELVNNTTWNNLAALDTSDGSIITAFNPSPDATVDDVVLSSDNSILYVGGQFNNIASTTKNYLAALNTSDGSLVSAFGDQNIDAEVESLALSSDGSILYIGGFFTSVGGETHIGLAAINTSDGSMVSAFVPDVPAGSFGVTKLVLTDGDSKLWFCGGFTSVNSTTRNYIASVNTSDGSLDLTFDPNADHIVYNMLIT